MSDEIFDPEIHSADKEGNPTLNKDGSFRKKRRDASPRAPRASRSGRSASKTSAPTDLRSKYVRTVGDTLGVLVAGASMADPVMGYAAARLAPLWAEGLANLALEQPRLAAVLERAAPLGAATALAGLGVMTFVQFGHLAGKIPPEAAKMAGAMTRVEIEAELDVRGASLRAQGEAARQHPQHAEQVTADV